MKRIVTASILTSLIAGSAAMAGTPPHWTSDRGRDPHNSWRRDDGRFNDRDRGGYERHYDHRGNRYDHRDYRPDRYWRGEYRRPSGWYSHRWCRGERLPRAFYGRPYFVYGYHDYGLYAPPRGYSWVRVDSDIVLTALATGLVLDVVYNQFY